MPDPALDPRFVAKLLELLGPGGDVRQDGAGRLVLRLGDRSRLVTAAEAQREGCTLELLAVSAALKMAT